MGVLKKSLSIRVQAGKKSGTVELLRSPDVVLLVLQQNRRGDPAEF